MSGRHITARQQGLYMSARQNGATQALSAARAGISERSGRTIEQRAGWLSAGQRGRRANLKGIHKLR